MKRPWKPQRRQRPEHVSHVEAYGACPKLYEFQIKHRVRSVGFAPPLVVGTGMHAATAVLRAGGGIDAALFAAAQVVKDAPKPRPGDDAKAAAAAARLDVMVRGYCKRWWYAMDQIGTTANEVMLQAPLINPATGKESRTFFLEGTLDGILPGPRLYEQKTTSDTLDETEAYLRAGLQVPIYCELIRHNFGEPGGVVIDLVKKPTVQRRKKAKPPESLVDWGKRCLDDYAKRPDHFFRRIELPYDEGKVRWALTQFWRTAEAIRHDDKHGYRAIRSWKCCKGPAGWCRFKSLCWHSELDGFEIGKGEQANERASTGNERQHATGAGGC